MWTLKFTSSTENTVVGRLAVKHSVIVQLYPILSNRSSDDRFVDLYGIVFGDPEQKSGFLADFGSLSEVVNIEVHNDAFLFRYREKIDHIEFFESKIIFLEPWTIDGPRGAHYLTLGSWDRSSLTKVFNNIQSYHESKILNLQISKLKEPSLVFCSIRPSLTPQQQLAIDLAIKHGYYDHPRRTSVEKLSKHANLSFSTFQNHLRKAENKLIPYSHKTLFGDMYR